MKTFKLFLILNILFISSLRSEYFRTMNMDDGLIHYSVHGIFQDVLGRMWFGTTEGISVYDGNKMTSIKVYDFLHEYPLLNRIIKNFSSDKYGNVYFMAADYLLQCNVKDNSLKVLHNDVSLLVKCGENLFTVSKNTVYRLDVENLSFDKVFRLPFSNVVSMIKTEKDIWWFTTPKGLFSRNEEGKIDTVIEGNDFRSVIEDSNGNIWACSFENGLYRVSSEDNKITIYNVKNSSYKGFVSNNVRCIVEDKDCNMWIGTFHGLFKLDTETQKFTKFSWSYNKGGLGHSSVYSVFIDKDETVWAGTYRGGVSYYRPNKDSYKYYSASDDDYGFSYPVIGDMIEDSQGNLMVCTKGGGLNIIDLKSDFIHKFTTRKYPFYLPHTNLKSIYHDKEEDCFYIGTNSKDFFMYNPVNKSFYNIFQSDYIVHAIEKDAERLFLATNRGVHLYNITERKDTLLYRFNMSKSGFMIDDYRRLWISAGDKLVRFNIDNMNIEQVCSIEEMGVKKEITYLYKTDSGDIYACSLENGLYKYDSSTDSFISFPSSQNFLSGVNCYKIIEYPGDKLVVTTSIGIIGMNTDGTCINMINSWKSMPIHALSEDCGLYVSNDSVLYVGGMNGMMAFDLDDFNSYSGYSDVNFLELYIGGNLIHPLDSTNILSQILPFTSDVTLAYNQNKIDIEFSLNNTTEDIGDYIFEYKLKEEDNWYKPAGNIISYSNLSPGTYTLQFRGKRIFDSENSLYKEFGIKVLPPWYMTWWAYLLWGLLFLMLLYTVYRILMNQKKLYDSIIKEKAEKENLKNINEMKLRFFTSLSHEFKTPLSLIVGYLEAIIQNYNLHPVVNKKINKAIKQTTLLNNLVTEIIDFRKYEQGKFKLRVSECNVNSFVEEAISDFKEQALLLGLRLEVHYDCNQAKAWFDKKEMLRVFYNLLSNALKYTQKGGLVSVCVSSDETNVYISFSDNGIGMTSEDMKRIFEHFYIADSNSKSKYFSESSGIGLPLVKNIIDLHNGSIVVESEYGCGAIFKITLPLGNNHFHDNENVVICKDTDISEPKVSDILLEEVEDEDLKQIKVESVDGTNPIVVIVEDNTELLGVLSDIFQPMYDVKTASDGTIGYELIMETKPDLIVSDVMMPGMNGKDLCKKVKNNIETCHIPVVLLTALNQESHSMEGFLCGADDYISKPFNSKLLLIRCNNIIRSRILIRNKFGAQTETTINTLATNNLDKEFLDKIQSILEENLENTDFDIDSISNIVGMSRTSLYNKFKKITGQTPNDFIMTYKLNKSALMLRSHPEFTVAEISYKLGFNTPNYFNKKFKDHFGKTPTQYRKEHS